ncbi:importin-13-like protein cdm isoform X2 [Calliopsis andreniformis]
MAKVAAEESKEEKQNVVEEITNMLSYDTVPMLELLLCTLSSLPAELKKSHRTKKKPQESYECLANGWCKTAWVLQQVFSMCDIETLHQLALECTLSWLKFNSELPLDATGQIFPHLLRAAAYYAPNREGPNEENAIGWEVVQECLKIILCVGYGPNGLLPTLWNWAHSLVSMAKQYSGKYFCEILACMGESHSTTFLYALLEDNETEKWTSENLIELLLQCSEQEGRYPTDETRSYIPFGFWYSLHDSATCRNQYGLPYGSRTIEVLKPVYMRLVHALLRKSTLPSSPSEAGDATEREQFRCYRQDVADTMGYCYRILGEDLLAFFGQRLSQAIEGSEKWTNIEAILHALEAVADYIFCMAECQYIPALMDLILTRIPYDLYPGEVLASACSIMGAYAEWVAENPDPWLEKVLRIVVLGLAKGSTSASLASMALRDLARECEQHIAPFTPSILTIIEQSLPNITPGDPEGIRLMFAAGQLLKTLPTAEEQLVHLDATLGLCIIKIRELLKQPLFSARVAVTHQLKMVSRFLAGFEKSIGKSLMDRLLPIFDQITSHPEWSQDNATLEGMYICAQKSVTVLAHPEVDAVPLLLILTLSYRNWPHPAALDLLRQLVLLLGRHPSNVIGPVFAELSSITLSVARACRCVRGNLSDWAELLESYFLMLAQVCKRNIGLLLQFPNQIPEMLQCGIDCLPLPETRTGKAAGYFLFYAIMESQHLHSFIQPVGQEIVSMIFRCASGEIPRHNLEPHAEVLFALFKMCNKAWSEQWLRVAFETQSEKFSITQAQKNAFMHAVLTPNKIGLTEMLKELSLHNLASANNSAVTSRKQ